MLKEKKPKLWFEESPKAARKDKSFEMAEKSFSKPNALGSILRFPDFRMGAIPIKMAETKDEMLLRAELPGFTKEDIKLKVTPNLVYITAEKKTHSSDKGSNFFAKTSVSSTMSRILQLPKEAKTDGVRARFRNDILEVVIPKKD
jgi:HSP20 family molecular chaperone IbpA